MAEQAISQHSRRTFRLVLESYAGHSLSHWEEFESSIELVRIAADENLPLHGGGDAYFHFAIQGLFRGEARIGGRYRTIFLGEEGDIIAPLMSVGVEEIIKLAPHQLLPRSDALLPDAGQYRVTCLEGGRLFRVPFGVISRLAKMSSGWANLSINVAIIRAMALQADCAWMRLDAQERYEVLAHRNPNLVRRVTQRELAAYLNVTEATLSRIVKRVRVSTVSAASEETPPAAALDVDR